MLLKNNRLISILLLFVIHVAFSASNSIEDDFKAGLEAAKQHREQVNNSIKTFKPEQVYKNFSDKPDETKLMNSATDDANALNEIGSNIANSKTNLVGESVRKAAKHVSEIDKKALNKELEENRKVQSDADNIVKGISDEFADCTKQEECKVTYTDKMCIAYPQSTKQFCKKTLEVQLIPHQVDTHYPLTINLHVRGDHDYAGVVISAINGGLGFLGPREAGVELYGRLPKKIDCKTLHGSIIRQTGSAKLDYAYLPSCSSGLVINMHMSQGHSLKLDIDMISSVIEYEQKDVWHDNCLGLENSGMCTLKSEQCVRSNQIENIQGIKVSRACWEKEVEYECLGSFLGQGTCKQLQDDGCEQIGSECSESDNGQCLQYKQSYQCPTKTCSEKSAICNGKTYCMDGDCTHSERKADPDFGQAVSALSGAMDAAARLNTNQVFIGKPAACDDVILGAANCCKDKGWLINDVPLMHCSEEEKELGKAKESGLVTYIGKYDDDCVLGVCAVKKKVYCIFPTKLARIIQEQGRKGQLGRDFGSAKDPDCTGIKFGDPDQRQENELQKIDFSKIDFSDYTNDIYRRKTEEDPSVTQQRIERTIDQYNKLRNAKQ